MLKLEGSSRRGFRTATLTALAMAAFAANSILCRLALGARAIDAASFSTIRLASGATMLVAIASATRGFGPRGRGGSWLSGALLFLYAVPFSFAYLSLTAGTGALILFASVQATMITAGLRGGERPHPLAWLGLAAALTGLVVLVLPGLAAPSPLGSALMVAAGLAWGVYSLRGRGAVDPIAATTDNFVRALPFAVAVSGLSIALSRSFHITSKGAVLALASGAVTSGVGYVVWYAALRGLTATRAATVQLSVPVIAALGGVIFLSETLTLRLTSSSTLVLGGVALVLAARSHEAKSQTAQRPG